MFDFNEITVTNRFGYAILTDGRTGKALVTEPTMAGPDIIAFHIIERCEDYQLAFLLTLALNDAGIHPQTYEPEGGNDAPQDEAAAAPDMHTGESVPLALAQPEPAATRP